MDVSGGATPPVLRHPGRLTKLASIVKVVLNKLRPRGDSLLSSADVEGIRAGTLRGRMTGTSHTIFCHPANQVVPKIFASAHAVYRYRSRDNDRADRYLSKHRSREADQRKGGRDDRSARHSHPYGDRPRSREAKGKSAAGADDMANEKSLVSADVITEAPKQRPALKAGPAGGAYIPPFRLLQVLEVTHVTSTPIHCEVPVFALTLFIAATCIQSNSLHAATIRHGAARA